MTAKEQLLKDKKLAGEWNTIVNGETFEKAMLHVRCALMETAPTREELIGAEHVIHIMSNISQNEAAPFDFPSPGIIHDIDKMPEKPLKD